MAGKWGVTLFLLTSLFVAFIAKTLINGGYFKIVLNHSPGPCKLYKVNGSEDIEILPNGVAIISSGLRYESGGTHDPEIDKREGKIYLIDLNDPNPTLEEIMFRSFDRTGFNPHGISVFVDPETGGVRLFVVNHKTEGETIEIFQFEQESKILTHFRSVMDENIHSANDVKATGPESFYVTNDHYFRFGSNSPLRQVEMFVFAGGSVVYYDGSHGVIVASQIVFPNGINMDSSGRYVFVSSIGQQGIRVYKRLKNHKLEFSQLIWLGTHADNIFVDEHDDLWTGALPSTFEFVKHELNISHPSPSHVINVRLGRAQSTGPVFPNFELREVYSDNGRQLKSSSSAAMYRGKLLIGTVFDNLLYCEMKTK